MKSAIAISIPSAVFVALGLLSLLPLISFRMCSLVLSPFSPVLSSSQVLTSSMPVRILSLPALLSCFIHSCRVILSNLPLDHASLNGLIGRSASSLNLLFVHSFVLVKLLN